MLSLCAHLVSLSVVLLPLRGALRGHYRTLNGHNATQKQIDETENKASMTSGIRFEVKVTVSLKKKAIWIVEGGPMFQSQTRNISFAKVRTPKSAWDAMLESVGITSWHEPWIDNRCSKDAL